MPKTETERRIQQRRKQKGQPPTILVGLLTELLKSPLGIDTEEDARWLYDLAMKGVERERVRQASYDNDEMVFSPSGLADCLRRVYLSKNHKKFGLKRISLEAPTPHFYFFTGDFLHLKWQFAMHRLMQMHPEFHLVDCEVPIMSKRKDHGGTLDVVCFVGREPFIVDVKGLNRNSFYNVGGGSPDPKYRVQVADYLMLFNSALTRGTWKPDKPTRRYMKSVGLKEFPKVKRGIILAENKGGPDQRYPVALAETIISLKENLPEVRLRLEELRGHEEEGTIPEIECITTRGAQFQGCPFAGVCLKEVQEAERRAASDSFGKAEGFQLARPARRRRTRRS